MSDASDVAFTKDCLGREVFASKMVEIISNFKAHEKSKDAPNTLAITGPYGYGKSWLTRKIIEKINLTNTPPISSHTCIYFNAWKYDYWEQPLMAIVEQLAPDSMNVTFADETKKILQESYNNLKESTTKILPKVFATTAIVSSAYSDLSTEADSSKDSTHLLKNLESFQLELQNYIHKTQLNMLYIFIDELDCCRPNFIIDLLEIIKHLFNVEKVIFIFCIEKDQLCAAINHSYGRDADAGAYLRRFFYAAYKLPIPIHEDYLETSIHSDSPFYFLKNSILEVIQVTDLDPRNVTNLLYLLQEACSLETYIFNKENAAKSTNFAGSNRNTRGTMLTYGEIAQGYILFLALRIKNPKSYFQFAKSRQVASEEGVNLDYVVSEFIFQLEQMEQEISAQPMNLSKNIRSILIEDKQHLTNQDAKNIFTTFNTASLNKKSYFKFFYNSIEHLEYF